ncbi:penicillin-binding protein 1A [Marivibrio halodurans]|uniref:Penicillin-binding protein 1A n=1 Tax=Marivibrio halodurans TaxID=2039722 RepID=A0A8J7RZY0_9PROT|nr:penicillin-binding protein 1A [Marivibrio halodurans]MBP5856138.1 penicillin-binding protein 1A [Marivibrio halodurans]
MRALKFFGVLVGLFVIVLMLGVGGAIYGLWHYGRDLPDYKQLADYQPPTSTRVHAGDGRLLAEFATEKRVFVPIEAMPRKVIEGFIAAEDQNFFHHGGVDFVALTRAVLVNIQHYMNDRRPIGASTITQQVAKNFLLTNEVSIERKIKEAILAFRIERALSKDRILELYLNEIYLGVGSYGVAAAALNYFDKSLDELRVDEIAYLAALPKAPNNYHPTRRTAAAVARRNWVLSRMREEGFIDAATEREAAARPLEVRERRNVDVFAADYFLEEVRREMIGRFGESGLYEGGLFIHTTLDATLQRYAREALRDGLVAYDRRHGWRGPVTTIDMAGLNDGPNAWAQPLADVPNPLGNPGWRLAVVLSVDPSEATLGLVELDDSGVETGTIPVRELNWARAHNGYDDPLGPSIQSAKQVLNPGDVVLVESVREGRPKEENGPPVEYPEGTYTLRQIPEISGAVTAMDPHTGRVLAMSGGWSFELSQFNRATQAERQPGSSFKPFVYLTALENGFTPATIILDAPFVIDQGQGLGKWKPANFSHKFYGPSPMRIGIEKSRNLMTVRLAQAVGMEKISATAARFGIKQDMAPQLAMALGAAAVRPIDMVSAYSALVNGGKKVEPTLIDRVQDRHGRIVYRHDRRDCPNCDAAFWDDQSVPALPDTRPRIASATSAYQIVTMLEGVVQRGTGRSISTIGKPLAGKTGTSNDSRDTWFMGFSPDLVFGVFVGFDTPKPLGRQPWGGQETGSSVAAPIFKEFMEKALADKPAIPFRTPPGIRMVRIDAETGTLAKPSSRNVITEAFKVGTEPGADARGTVLDGGGLGSDGDATASGSESIPVPSTGEAPTGLY